MTKRRLYKEKPKETLNEDGTRKTLQQQFYELNDFINKTLSELGNHNEDR